jgi:hypothetical protein
VGEIERVRGDSPVVRAELQLSGRTYPGEPLVYVPAAYDIDDSWSLLPETMQTWAEDKAGPSIRDPHTREPTIYWYCRVVPTLTDGPSGAARPAAYSLVMFGKRGLVCSTGQSHNLDARNGPRWRHRRIDVAIDPDGLRHEHHREAAANPTSEHDSDDTGGQTPVAEVLPQRITGVFGNLPAATQRFLLQTFVREGRRAAEADVFATTRVFGPDYQEQLWAYLFDARHMAFAYAHRSVPWRDTPAGPALWTTSPEAAAIRQAPWTVVAWTAPRLRHPTPGGEELGRAGDPGRSVPGRAHAGLPPEAGG